MAEAEVLSAQNRRDRGTRASQRLRKQGLIPAVIYGHGENTVSIALPEDELHRAIDHGVRVVEIQHGGLNETVQIRDIQWDYLGQELLHADFVRVSKDEKIQVEVALELRGVSPGAEEGGVLDHQLHSMQVECLPLQVPESIEVNINSLGMEEIIFVRDLQLPEGVVALEDEDEIVVQVRPPQEEEEVEEEVGQAEPEIIGRPAEEEEGETPNE